MKNVTVPDLEIDARMLAQFGRKVGPIGRIERALVAGLCAHMSASGWNPCEVYDGDNRTPVWSAKSAMELIFNLDDCYLYFANEHGRRHWVRLVFGNSGWDTINDYSYAPNDTPHGAHVPFGMAMESFDLTPYGG